MRRFRKRPDLAMVFLPGRGRVRDSEVLVGDDFAKFCPALLVEMPHVAVDSAPRAPVVEKPLPAPVVPSVPPVKPPEPVPDKTWSRKSLAEFAAGLGVKTTGMTKTELLAAIQRVRS